MASLRCQLNVPAQDLATLSFAIAEPLAVTEWVGQLPMANTIESAGLLHRAATELGRLAAEPAARLKALEALRPPLHYICARLDRTSGHGSGAGEGHAQLAQSLQIQLSLAYKSVVRALVAGGDPADRDLLAQAIHRALSDSSRTLVRAAQYYSTVPQGTWYELNHLLHLAEHTGVAQESCDDDENHAGAPMSITDVYLRAALFAVCKPNQLRPPQLGRVFNALEQWTPELSLSEVRDDTLFAVDLEADAPPGYRDIGSRSGSAVRGIRTDVLVYGLEAYLAEIASDVPVPDYLDNELLRHLVHAWGVLKKRSFRRTRANGCMKVAVGLRNVHYFVSGGVDFAQQIGTTEALLKREINPFLEERTPAAKARPADVWDDAFDLRGARIPENPNIVDPSRILLAGKSAARRSAHAQTYPCHDAEIVDTSPGGYCIRFTSNEALQLVAGELVSVREQNANRWVLAVVRWIGQDDDMRAGIELLSPKAIPVALRLIQKRGGRAEHARALLLPEIPSIAQPAMLITPRVPFRESQKVSIERQGVVAIAQLMRRVRMTESFTQFTFRMLDGYLESVEIALNMESLWDMIGAEASDNPKRRK
jgi:hypothetical protein